MQIYPNSYEMRPKASERAWVFMGGFFLAGIAGFVNICLLGYFEVPVSHMTGAVARLSRDVDARDAVDLLFILYIVAGFLAGAVLSGILIGGKRLIPGRRYGITLVIEGLIIGASAWLLLRNEPMGVPLAAMACGVQNAMASSYYGMILRTTHMTGIITDIGMMIGHWIRHREFRFWRIMLLIFILAGFFTGGVAGALGYRVGGMEALYVPAAGCIIAGIGYFIWRQAGQVRVKIVN
jgi:uncharacterized membrane protein YoaK (UPF0700 family)